jgi:parallel beta-helix repeat protein
MNRKLVLALALTLLVGTLNVAFNVQKAKASGTIYIRADGSIDPPTAPILTVDNVTYTLTDSINSDADGILVKRSNIIIGGNGYTLQGSGSGNGFYLSGINNVTIKNIEVKTFGWGIILDASSNNIIQGNTITNSYSGIALFDFSSYNSIQGNNVTSNNGYGIALIRSSNNTLRGNSMTNNKYNFKVESVGGNAIPSDFLNDVDASNTVDGRPVYYWVDRQDMTVPLDAGYVALVNCTNITVQNLSLINSVEGLLLVSTTDSTISQNSITNNELGIDLMYSSNNDINGNNITNNGYGIALSYSSNNSVAENNITNNNGYGIGFYWSSYNSISGNNITNNMGGISLSPSNNVLRDNFMANNTYNFDVEGSSVHDVDSSNTVNGKPIYYLVNTQDLTVPLDAGYVALVNCTNITVKNLNLANNGQGILLVNTTNSIITQNKITSIGSDGIRLEYSTSNNISGNNVTDNEPGATGLDIVYSSNNNIHGNNVRNNSWGVYLYSCSGTNIFGNSITDNGDYGVCLAESSNNAIYENHIVNNLYDGIALRVSSSNNTIYHNIFINNWHQVDSEKDFVSIWDDGYPSGGNYWSDYAGADEFSGPNQDQPGSDGIGDTPYVIDEGNRDHYPLVTPEHELAVSIIAPSSLRVESSSMLTATITNKGSNDEASVELLLLINGTNANSTTISLLQAGNSYTLNYLWTPTVEGTYNVTAYAPPVLGEALTENNQQTILVNVSAPEIVVSSIAPTSLRVGTSSLLNATVSRQVLGDLTNVELRLLINGTIMISQLQALLQPGDSYTLSYLWTPTVEGTYNVTAYSVPVPGETSLENNLVTKFVTVTASLPPGMQVGVKTGDWIKIDYTVAGAPSGTNLPLWLKVEFLSVEGTNATVRVTMHMSDGTEQNATMPVDVVAGGGTFQGLSGFLIPANCTTGDSVYLSGYGNVTIAGETTSSYAGATRTVVYASLSQYGTQLAYHWDKLTGTMVEASVVSGGVTATGKATETNMWQAAPSGLLIEPIYLYILAALVIIIVVGAATFLVRRKKKPPEEVERPQT